MESAPRKIGSHVLSETSGACGDLGTFVPHVIGAMTVAGLAPVGVLFGFGVFLVTSGLFYGIPIPVQPMKAVSAVLLTEGLDAGGVAATGLAMDVVLLVLALGLCPRLQSGRVRDSAPIACHRASMFANIQGWLYGGAIGELKGLASGVSPLRLFAPMSIATVFGFVHAFMPGHGKTVLVSYYLGRPGRLLASIGTSAILVVTHVGSAVFLALTGFIVIRRTIGGAGRAPAFETMSSALIAAIGLWLLFRALRPHDREHSPDGRVLAFATGLVPCPLTTFIMVYASANGIIFAGLLVTAGMAAGMVVTIALFAIAAVLLRDRLVGPLERTERIRGQIGRTLEVGSALAIVAFGAWLLTTR